MESEYTHTYKTIGGRVAACKIVNAWDRNPKMVIVENDNGWRVVLKMKDLTVKGDEDFSLSFWADHPSRHIWRCYTKSTNKWEYQYKGKVVSNWKGKIIMNIEKLLYP